MCIFQRLLFFLFVLSASAYFKGRRVKEGEFPFVVAIVGNFKVAGILISFDKIISSAHRTANELRRWGYLTAIAGVVVTSDWKNEQYQVRNIIYFKPYVDYQWKPPYGILHDIAVAVVDKPFLISASVNIAPFVSEDPEMIKITWDELPKNKTECQVVTWAGKRDNELDGYTETDMTLSVMNALPLEEVDCIKSLNDSYTPEFTCVRSGDLYFQLIRLKISSGIMICNGNVYSIYYLFHGNKSRVHMFLGLWRYLDYFKTGGKSYSSSLLHVFPFNFLIPITQYL